MTKPYAIGIDIGGTNTVVGIVDTRGNVISSISMPTQKHADFNDYTNEIYLQTKNMLLDSSISIEDVQGIGVGAPNANYYTGTIDNAANLRWKGILPLCDNLKGLFGIPVSCTNDANAAAIAEMTYGAARGMKNFIMITLGTGVGSGIVANGQVLYGNDGFAGELGHMIIRRQNGRQCGCGRCGCLECYCSATGVTRTAKEMMELTEIPSVLRTISSEELTSKNVYDAARNNDKLALQVFEYTGKVLGEALADFATFLAPEAIILFGGLAKAGNMILEPTKKSMEKNILFVWKNKIDVILSELKETDAAVLGASALGWEVNKI